MANQKIINCTTKHFMVSKKGKIMSKKMAIFSIKTKFAYA